MSHLRLLGGNQAEAEAQDEGWRNAVITACVVLLSFSVCCCWCVIVLCGHRLEKGQSCPVDKIAMWIAKRGEEEEELQEDAKKRARRKRKGGGAVAPAKPPIVLGQLKGKDSTKLGKGKMAKQVEERKAASAVGAAPSSQSSLKQVKAAVAARV